MKRKPEVVPSRSGETKAWSPPTRRAFVQMLAAAAAAVALRDHDKVPAQPTLWIGHH